MPIMIPVLNHVTNSHQLVQDGFSIHSMFVSIFLPPKNGGWRPQEFPIWSGWTHIRTSLWCPATVARLRRTTQKWGWPDIFSFLRGKWKERSKTDRKTGFPQWLFSYASRRIYIYMFGLAPLSFHFNMFQPHVAVDANILTYRISQKKHKGRYGDAPFWVSCLSRL